MAEQKRVIIVGAGFGGLRAAKALAGQGLDVLLVDRQNYHLFQPLLYQVAAAELEQEAIAYPVRAIIRRWQGVRFQLTEVTGVDRGRRELLTTSGPLPYDYLIIAAGSVTNFFGLDSVREHAHDLKQLDDAVDLRNQLLSAFERAVQERDPARRTALMSFVIIGGGPTGVEFAGALAELVRHVLRKDYPELRVEETRIILVEAGDRLLAALPEKLQRYTLKRLRKMGVDVRLNTAVSGADDQQIMLKDGSTIPACTVLWAAGVRAAPIADGLALPQARGGRLVVKPDLTLEGHPEIFAIGDIAYLEQDGAALPMVAAVAMQQGTYAGETIVRREQGTAVRPFRYQDKGAMATIGRNSAVASVFGLKVVGFLAWVIWLALHLFYLIGFRNRLVVMLNWAYDYLLFERQVRLITTRAQAPASGYPGDRGQERAQERGGKGQEQEHARG